MNKRLSFRYREAQDTYEMQLRHRKCRWWLLLFLLPLLLLIQCHKDITVTCIDAETGEPVSEQEVTLAYDAHFLFKSGNFFTTEKINLTQDTDEGGKTVFRKVPCSVFSYLFYCLSDMTVSATGDCYEPAEEKRNFHFTSSVELKMTPLREDLHVKLLDEKTGAPLPYSTLVYTYVNDGKEKTDSVKANARGVATMPNMLSCGVMKQLLGRCDDYIDTMRVDVPCQDLLEPDDEQALRLRPLLDPCNASGKSESNVAAGSQSRPQSFNMGQKSGSFVIEYNTGSNCSDCIDIYNHNPREPYNSRPPIRSTGQVVTDGKRTETISFSQGSVITIVVTTGKKDNSFWEYHLRCPE